MKILFVDDNKDLGEVFLSLAQMKKVDLVYLESPLEALDFLQANKVDIVITDVNMPRMTGEEFVKELRLRRDRTPIIFSSGVDGLHTDRMTSTYGALKFIPKTELPRIFDQITDLKKMIPRPASNDLEQEFNDILMNII